MDKITITYDSIFEVLMREKGKDELQKISPTFLNDVLIYIAEKKKVMEGGSLDAFALEEKDRTAKQLQNIKRMLTELYERREKKIVNMAIIRSRTGADIIDTTALLAEERLMFDAMIAQLDYYRNNVLFKVLNGRIETPKKEEKKTASETKLVRFIHSVPKFVGKELEVYGPYVEEDMANLPTDIANLLIQKGRAEEIY